MVFIPAPRSLKACLEPAALARELGKQRVNVTLRRDAISPTLTIPLTLFLYWKTEMAAAAIDLEERVLEA